MTTMKIPRIALALLLLVASVHPSFADWGYLTNAMCQPSSCSEAVQVGPFTPGAVTITVSATFTAVDNVGDNDTWGYFLFADLVAPDGCNLANVLHSEGSWYTIYYGDDFTNFAEDAFIEVTAWCYGYSCSWGLDQNYGAVAGLGTLNLWGVPLC